MDPAQMMLPEGAADFLSLAFATSPGAITISRVRDGRYLAVNEGFTTMSGWPAEEVVGRTSLERDIWYDEAERDRFIGTLLRDGKVQNMACRFRHRSGAIIHGHMSASLFDVNGERHLFAVTQDISEIMAARQQAEVSEARLRSLVAHLPHGVCEVDLSGAILLENAACSALLGHPPGSLTGTCFPDLINESQEAAAMRDFLARCAPAGARDSGHLMLNLRRRDGAVVYVRIDWTRQQPADGAAGAPTLICVLTDLTPTVRAQDELRRSVDELTRSNAELERYAYIAAHDLREPIRTVNSYAQLLRRRLTAQNLLTGETGELFDYLESGARRMGRVVDDLLAYSRLQTRAAPFEQVDLNDTLVTVCNNLARTIDDQNAEVTATAPLPTLTADGSQMVQLLQNLVANGLRYQPHIPGHVPRVTLAPRRRDGGWSIAVTDNGIGIEPRYYTRIFELFQRLHSQREYAGTGVGLAICKRIVERHGGSLSVESEPGRGSVFTVWLPDQPPEDDLPDSGPA